MNELQKSLYDIVVLCIESGFLRVLNQIMNASLIERIMMMVSTLIYRLKEMSSHNTP